MPSESTTPRRRFFIRPTIRALPSHKYNTNMSSITPQSFVDDGGSFTKRVPRGLDQRHVANWIASNRSDTSAYTGSFIDDGADMQFALGTAPGFGPVDTRFYKQKKRKEPKDGAETLWNDDVQKAVSGDIQRNLEKIRGLGGLQVKKTDRGSRQDEVARRREKEKETVAIPMPPQWGTFVIKAGNGRIIVVDKDGEFDSGPQKAVGEQAKHWVKAASTVEIDSPDRGSIPPSPPKNRTSTRPSRESVRESGKQKTGSEGKDKHRKCRQSHHSLSKILTPMAESEYEESYLPFGGEDMGSPTDFMMTGGARGWLLSRATSVGSPSTAASDGYEYMVPKVPIKAISEGFRRVTPRSRGYNHVVPESNSWTEVKNGSQGWGGSEKSFNSKRGDREPARTSHTNTPHPHTWAGAGSKSPSEQSWSKRPKAGDNASGTDFEHSAFQQTANSPTSVHFGVPTRPPSDAPWDGFERNKSTSEVGVLDTGSERASPGHQSQVSSRQSTHQSHRSHGTHAKHRSSKHAQPTDWEDGQTAWAGGSQTSHRSWSSHRPDDTLGWPGSRAVSEQSWGSQKDRVNDGNGGEWGGPHGAKGEYANATYLNDNWGGIAVRVGSRAGSRSSRQSGAAAAGWESRDGATGNGEKQEADGGYGKME